MCHTSGGSFPCKLKEHWLPHLSVLEAGSKPDACGFKSFWAPANDTDAGSTCGGVGADRLNAWTEPGVDAQLVLGRLAYCILRAGHPGGIIWSLAVVISLAPGNVGSHGAALALAARRGRRLADGAGKVCLESIPLRRWESRSRQATIQWERTQATRQSARLINSRITRFVGQAGVLVAILCPPRRQVRLQPFPQRCRLGRERRPWTGPACPRDPQPSLKVMDRSTALQHSAAHETRVPIAKKELIAITGFEQGATAVT